MNAQLLVGEPDGNPCLGSQMARNRRHDPPAEGYSSTTVGFSSFDALSDVVSLFTVGQGEQDKERPEENE